MLCEMLPELCAASTAFTT